LVGHVHRHELASESISHLLCLHNCAMKNGTALISTIAFVNRSARNKLARSAGSYLRIQLLPPALVEKKRAASSHRMKHICDSTTRLNVSSQGDPTDYFCCREQCVSTQFAVCRKSGRTPLMSSGDILPAREGMVCTNSRLRLEREHSRGYALVKNCLFGEQMSPPRLTLSDQTLSAHFRIE
jgi:hypothetical protein